MATVRSLIKYLLTVVVLFVVLWVVMSNYSAIFSKTFEGEIVAIEKMETPPVVLAPNDLSAKALSFAVGIKDNKTGDIVIATSTDSQWSIAKPGQCAQAVFLPYPPWDFTKKGTFFGARMTRLYECPAK